MELLKLFIKVYLIDLKGYVLKKADAPVSLWFHLFQKSNIALLGVKTFE